MQDQLRKVEPLALTRFASNFFEKLLCLQLTHSLLSLWPPEPCPCWVFADAKLLDLLPFLELKVHCQKSFISPIIASDCIQPKYSQMDSSKFAPLVAVTRRTFSTVLPA
jgi:hypothetical protein